MQINMLLTIILYDCVRTEIEYFSYFESYTLAMRNSIVIIISGKKVSLEIMPR